MKPRRGHLVIVGGAEDREDDKIVLGRVVELSGGAKAKLVVLTTASRLAAEDPKEAKAFEELYERAFKDCGAGEVRTLHIHDRRSANDEENARLVAEATGVFMTGGDQSRLVSILGGTGVGEAMHEGYLHRGVCISGTSAGASAVSEHMVLGGPSDSLPRKGRLPLAPGLGFIRSVLIDQHFSQRQRLGRLLSVVAQNPFLMGIGIDEDTALVVTPEERLEVLGSGAVTVVDGREMDNDGFNAVSTGEVFALTDVRLHLLPSGFSFDLTKRKAGRPSPAIAAPSVTFIEAIDTIVSER